MKQTRFWSMRMCLGVMILSVCAYAQRSGLELLSLCGQCVNPTVFSKTGAGTGHAVAEARITFREAKDHCEQFAAPNNEAQCAKEAQQAVKEEAGKIYRATANCLSGRITAIDGKTYTLASTWTGANDIGRDRSRWRNAAGKIVLTSEMDGGLAISEQWEVLCPARRTAAAGGRR